MANALKLKQANKEPSKIVDEFSDLFCMIIYKLYPLKSREFLNNVKRALKGIRQLKYKVGSQDKVFYAEVDFKKAEMRCAYVYSYSLLNSAVVYSEFLEGLKQKETDFREMFSKKTLNLCCLAGGPATEAVAISKALYDFTEKFSGDDAFQLFTDVRVTVVDICEEWKSEAEAVLNALNVTKSLFHSRKISFHVDFLVADLLKPLEKNLQEKIKHANIVTVVKFASAVQERSAVDCMDCMPRMKKMMEMVINFMDYDSCLFMLDSAGGLKIEKVMDVTKGKSSRAKQLSLHKEYNLPLKPLLKMEEAIDFKRFSQNETLIPTRLGKISSSLWIKKSLVTREEKDCKAAMDN